MKKCFVAALLTLLLYVPSLAQDTIPHVKGRIDISVQKGTIVCDLVLSNMPQLSDYYFRLNSGMNLRYIKNDEPGTRPLPYERSLEDTLSSGESLAYYIQGEKGKYLPPAVRFNYTGMFPVISDTTGVVDWRGNIAFNGATLRVDGIQSAWIPILYDVKKDKLYQNVTYDLDITCNDCKVIYMNGSMPVSDTHAKVSSDFEQDLTFFAGDFKSVAVNGNYFLNPDANDQQLTQLEGILSAYQKFLEEKLNIPYKGKAVYVQTTPVSKNNAWAYASYPSIVNVTWGDGMKSVTDKNSGGYLLKTMTHELAHYYFGKVRAFNSPAGGMISEGFAEFIALSITKKFISENQYLSNLQSKVGSMRKLAATPMSNIRSVADYKNRELYVYYYAPILYLAIEKEIGEEKMWRWMRSLLLSPAVTTDYAFFEQTLKKAVNNETQFTVLREKYLVSDQAFQNAITTLQIPATINSSVAASSKTEPKTIYYFIFSRPWMDIGSFNNKIITHTEVAEITCLDAEFINKISPLAMKVKEACKNASGSSNDVNSYPTKEQAQEALKRWLNRYNKDGNMTVKVITP